MHRRPTPEEIIEVGDLGTQIYEKEIRSKLSEVEFGTNIAIDVDTGNWEIGPRATQVLEAKNKNARILNKFHLGSNGMPFHPTIVGGNHGFTVDQDEFK